VADQHYVNKLTAFSHALPRGWVPHWNYHDEAFGKVTWHIEPTESLEQLYAERAQQIRSKYDYLMLSYSGGIDSHTTAESFFKNDIWLDELMNRSATESYLDNDSLDPINMGKEAVLAAKPQIEKLRQYQPNLKATFLTWGEDLAKLWKQSQIHVDDYNFFSAHMIGKKFLHRFFPEVERSHKPGLIYAIDKPVIFLIDGEYYMTFVDERVMPHIMNETDADVNSPFECVPFFWHPDAERILRKQAHVIVRWFESNPKYKDLLTFPHRSNRAGPSTYYRNQSDAYSKIVGRLVYPSYSPDLWQTLKPKNVIWLEEETWWHRNRDNAGVANWLSVNNEYSNLLHSTFKQADKLEYIKPDGPNWNMPACFSKLYRIPH
jgi:hypothetical protein